MQNVYVTNHPNAEYYDILSTFAPTPLEYNDITFPTAEHLFQYLKFPTKDATYDWYLMQIARANTPFEATVLGTQRKNDRAPHLDKIIDQSLAENLVIRKNQKASHALRRAIDVKYDQCEEYRDALKATMDGVIVNLVSHQYWGCGKTGTGENGFGRLLMVQRQVRSKSVPE